MLQNPSESFPIAYYSAMQKLPNLPLRPDIDRKITAIQVIDVTELYTSMQKVFEV